MTWTPERKQMVKEMLREGLTGDQIAARIGDGITRNAVIGFVHRNPDLKAIGFKRSPGPQNIEKKRDLAIAAKRRKNVRGGTVSLNKIKAIQARAIVELFDAVPDIPGRFGAPQVAGMPLMMLGPRHCRWCVNSPEIGTNGHLFCGEVKQPDRPYCAYHATASLGKGTESERSAVRSALKVAA